MEWNIARVRADEVWRALDIAGAGVVVANMDTGVDWTHPALQSKYRGSDSDHNYNWYDCTGTYPSTPADGYGHGTHTMGTMVGSAPGGAFHIGMAPAAQWTAVKVLDDDGVGYDTWIHAGFQWLLAPTDLSGSNPDPGQAPDVVNNSWGPGLSNVADLTFLPDVQALRAAGIFPVFSAGNSGGLGDGSIATPAGYPESFAVGTTDFQDAIASFSSRGPSFWEELKPEVSAPGVDIRSSVPGGGYEGGWSGTSMAAPHAAGLAALLLSANPTLTVDDGRAGNQHPILRQGGERWSDSQRLRPLPLGPCLANSHPGSADQKSRNQDGGDIALRLAGPAGAGGYPPLCPPPPSIPPKLGGRGAEG